MDLKSVKRIRQRDKDIVHGYIKIIQSLFVDMKDNPYYIINQWVQDICLLYFHAFIETKILTDEEIVILFNLLRDNNKPEFDNFDYKLQYRSSRDGLGKSECVKRVYGKENILMIVESDGNNVCGGYTSTGWEINKSNGYTKDTKSFIFSIRSSRGHKPCISNVTADGADNALAYHSFAAYCVFRRYYTLNLWIDGNVYHNAPESYQSLPKDHAGFLEHYGEKIKELEVYQLL